VVPDQMTGPTGQKPSHYCCMVSIPGATAARLSMAREGKPAGNTPFRSDRWTRRHIPMSRERKRGREAYDEPVTYHAHRTSQARPKPRIERTTNKQRT
jgi:hypothetical protein